MFILKLLSFSFNFLFFSSDGPVKTLLRPHLTEAVCVYVCGCVLIVASWAGPRTTGRRAWRAGSCRRCASCSPSRSVWAERDSRNSCSWTTPRQPSTNASSRCANGTAISHANWIPMSLLTLRPEPSKSLLAWISQSGSLLCQSSL